MKRRFGDYGNYQTGSGSKRLFSPAHQRDQRSLEEAKKVMSEVMRKLELTDSKKNEEEFFQYIKSMIDNLNASTERKTTVGVFGKSGVGKSSLINAILGEQDLLPTGTINACTSVIIQIEANTTDEYTAEIEFIPKQEWEEEVKSYLHDKLSEGTESRHVGDTESSAEKIQAVYGDVGPKTTLEELMEDKKFAAIPEFLKSDKKTVSHNSASKLSEDITCFTVSRPDKYSPEQYFWPLVKTVIIKVPNDLLENLVFIDLPGTGDLNKSRDEMWKKCLSRCSTVWIVNEINRAASDKEPWKILTNCIKDIAHGGECNSITFICTKTDDINPNLYMKCYKLKETDLKIQGTKDTEEYKTRLKHACILNRNKRAKEQVKQMFSQQNELQINFACDENFLKVFTVSAQVFQLMECSILNGEDTEIPELRRLLEKLNNSVNNNFAKNYIQGAYGILSLIQGANSKTEHTLAVKLEVLRTLRKILSEKIASLQDALAKHHLSLDACLSEGVKKSETSSLNKADEVVIKSTIKDGRGYHRTLKALCKNNGYWRRTTSETSETIDLNETLCEDMYKHVNELFQELFPRDASGKNVKSDKSIRGMLQRFNIISRDMTEKYKESPVSLNLTFIKTQQNKQILRYEEEVLQRKKSVYKSIYESISSRMKQVYPDAAAITGKHCLVDMQKMLKDYIESSTPDMFCEAKTTMLNLFKDLTKHIERTLKDRLDGIVIQALTFNLPLPDVCTELESMTKLNMWPDKCDPVWLHDPVQTETFQTELGATGSQSKSKANPSTLTSSTKPVSTDDLQRVHMEKKIQMCDLQMSYLHLKTEKVKLQIQALKFQPQEQTSSAHLVPVFPPHPS